MFNPDVYNDLEQSYNHYNNDVHYKKASEVLQSMISNYLADNKKESAAEFIQKHIINGENEASHEFLEIYLSEAIKPRIVICCHVWTSGGIERVCSTVINKLNDKFDFIILVGPWDNDTDIYELPNNVKKFQIVGHVNFILPLFHAVNLLNASIFIGNHNFFTDFLPIYSMLKDTGTKTIAWGHTSYFYAKTDSVLYPLQINMNAYFLDANISTWSTTFSANAYSYFANNAALMPLPNTFNDVDWIKEDSSENIILSIARFHDPLKQADQLLRMFRLVLTEIPDATLLLVGRYDPGMIISKSEMQTVDGLLEELCIKDNVLFVGETDSVSNFYKKAKIFAHTSSSEGFSLVLNEAAQFGVPSVVFDFTGVDDIITTGVNGYIVPQRDIHAMADKIISLIKDNVLWEKFTKNAIAMSKRFDQSIICEKWENLFSLLLSTDDQDELNRQLASNFMEKPRDIEAFAKTLSHEYDDLLRRYYSEYSGKVETVLYDKWKPLVSIIIPVYNGANYLREAIDSALRQSYKNCEIIVVNDGSNDNGETERIAMSYGDKIRFISKPNGGVASALNLAIEHMNGEYFSWLSHDDVYTLEKIEKSLTAIKDCPMRIVYTDYDRIDENGNYIVTISAKELFPSADYEFGLFPLINPLVHGCSLLIHRSHFEKHGGFDERLKCTQDYELWFRMFRDQRLVYINEPLVKGRVHANQASAKSDKVIIEGDILWIDMLHSLNEKEILSLGQTEWNFWNIQAMYMKLCLPYGEATKYAENRLDECKKMLQGNLVSLIMIFHNEVDNVLSKIITVQQQRYRNIELILVNNASTEDTTVIKEYIKPDKRITIINIEHNVSAAEARNIGLEAATCEFVAFLNSGDFWDSITFEEQLNCLINDTNTGQRITKPLRHKKSTRLFHRIPVRLFNAIKRHGIAGVWKIFCKRVLKRI